MNEIKNQSSEDFKLNLQGYINIHIILICSRHIHMILMKVEIKQ